MTDITTMSEQVAKARAMTSLEEFIQKGKFLKTTPQEDVFFIAGFLEGWAARGMHTRIIECSPEITTCNNIGILLSEKLVHGEIVWVATVSDVLYPVHRIGYTKAVRKPSGPDTEIFLMFLPLNGCPTKQELAERIITINEWTANTNVSKVKQNGDTDATLSN